MEELIHMSCLGILCEKLGKQKILKPKVTTRPTDVTCPKCKEILKNTIGR